MSPMLRFHFQLAAIALPVFGLAAAGQLVRPELQPVWMTGAVFTAVLWMVDATLLHTQKTDEQRQRLVGNTLFATAMLALALAVKLAQTYGYLPVEGGNRMGGVATGLLMAAMGNRLPKAVASVMAGCRTPGELQSINRFIGWVMVVGGLAFALGWIAAPLQQAGLASFAIVGFTLVLLMGRIGWGVHVIRRAS